MSRRLIAIITVALGLVLHSDIFAQSQRGEQTAARRPGQRASEPARPASNERKVVRASHQEIIDGGTYYDDVVVDESHLVSGGCSSCGGGGCGDCSLSTCDSCNVPTRFCICFPSHGWVHAEYLNWYQSGMNLPPLVTNGPTNASRAAAGVLPGATIRYGGQDYHDDDRSGFRIRFGWWLAGFPGVGIEGEYVGLGEDVDTFFQNSAGTPIIGRPFFNVLTGANDAELVAFPNVINGNVSVTSRTQFDGAAVRFRKQLFGKSGCGYSALSCQTVPTSSRWDATLGYRFWELDEGLSIQESLTTTDNDRFLINDNFSTRNQFNGVELGVLWQGRRGWWSMDALMRLGIGNVHQTVTIDGSTQITESGVVTGHNTGFLAQSTNIGTFDRDEFTIVPELGLTLGYQMTKRLRVTGGYSLIYIGNVVRPGDQVSLDVNPNLLAPAITPLTGALRPQFQFEQTDYWVQGLSFGGEFRW